MTRLDIILAPEPVASVAARSEAATLRFYESSKTAALSVVVYNSRGEYSEGTRLALAQVIELQETLEDFIDKHADDHASIATVKVGNDGIAMLVEDIRSAGGKRGYW